MWRELWILCEFGNGRHIISHVHHCRNIIFHLNLTLKARIFFLFFLIDHHSVSIVLCTIPNSLLLNKVNRPWTSRISLVGSRDWLQSIPGRKKVGQVHGDREVRNGSLNVYLPFYVVYKNNYPPSMLPYAGLFHN